MSSEKRRRRRVIFQRGYSVHIMGIDGTWRRNGTLLDVSETGARLLVEGSIASLELRDFFLVLTTSARVYRRCELVRAHENEIGVKFLDQMDAGPIRKETASSVTPTA